MRPIKKSVKQQLDTLWHKTCALCESLYPEMHHALIYAQKQVDEPYAIVPLCMYCHRGAFGTIPQQNREMCELIAILRGGEDIIRDYPRYDWDARRIYLLRKYATHPRFLYASQKFNNLANATTYNVLAGNGGGGAGDSKKAGKKQKPQSE